MVQRMTGEPALNARRGWPAGPKPVLNKPVLNKPVLNKPVLNKSALIRRPRIDRRWTSRLSRVQVS